MVGSRRRTGDATPAHDTDLPDDARSDLPPFEDDSDDTAEQDIRDAATLLGVPEWVDPETGELANDEHTRLEDH
jgi:hypothetical protein